jgi:OOP family OmpA-OmpF porin
MSLASCQQNIVGAFSADDNIAAAKMAGPPTQPFSAALQQEYITIAQREVDEADWEHGDLFARKGIAAGNGEMVMPEETANWMLPDDKAQVFADARGSLVSALDGGGREIAPDEAAIAQANFDCWIQEEEIENEGFQEKDIAYCRGLFWDNLAIVQTAIAPKPVPEPMAEPVPAPEPVARDYLVFFDFDKTNIRADAASILDRVAEAMAEIGSNSVTLVGHTDTMGPAEYNQTLSVERAMSVADFLKSKGITRGISTSGVGQTDLRVPTPDQVEEQENRNVQIRIN